jgi:hypothetical protein
MERQPSGLGPRHHPPARPHREDWKGQGPALGRAEAAHRLDEAHKLLEEIADMRRAMLVAGEGPGVGRKR